MTKFLANPEGCELLQISERSTGKLCRNRRLFGWTGNVGGRKRVDSEKSRAWLKAEGEMPGAKTSDDNEPKCLLR